MKGNLKLKIARSLSGSSNLNRKAVQVRKSWDEVDSLLKNLNKPKKK